MSNFMTVKEVAFMVRSIKKNHYYARKSGALGEGASPKARRPREPCFQSYGILHLYQEKGTIASSKIPKGHLQENESRKCCSDLKQKSKLNLIKESC